MPKTFGLFEQESKAPMSQLANTKQPYNPPLASPICFAPLTPPPPPPPPLTACIKLPTLPPLPSG